MADIFRVVPAVKVENRGLFSSHSGNVYVSHLASEDNAKNFYIIWTASPTTSHFVTGPDIGSLLIDSANGVVYVKTATSTWTKVGAQT